MADRLIPKLEPRTTARSLVRANRETPQPAVVEPVVVTPGDSPSAEGRQVAVRLLPATRDAARAAYRVAAFHEHVPTFSAFVEGAILREVQRIEQAYNDGRPLDPDPTPIPPGRH